jgi:hypothetical protein
MDEPGLAQPAPEEVAAFRRALLQIHAAAVRGLDLANHELPAADEKEDWEYWSLWRGYRRAMLEILAITNKLPLTETVEVTRPYDQGQTPAGPNDPDGQSVKPA